jgi:hypothetical protein
MVFEFGFDMGVFATSLDTDQARYTQIADANWQLNGDGTVQWQFSNGTPTSHTWYPSANAGIYPPNPNVWSDKDKGKQYPDQPWLNALYEITQNLHFYSS